MNTDTCYWCDGTDDVQTFANGWDWNQAIDPEPPTISLCAGCRAKGGITTGEPDACSEHRAGCPTGSHTVAAVR